MSSPSVPPTKPVLRGSAILILWGNIDTLQTNEDALNDWWTNEHLRERLSLPGFNRARRYYNPNSQDCARQYLALYEVSTLDDLASPQYMSALNNPTPKTIQFMPCLAHMNRSACTVVASKSRPWGNPPPRKLPSTTPLTEKRIASVVFFPPSPTKEEEEPFICRIVGGFTHRLLGDSNVLSFHLIRQEENITLSGSSSKSYDGVRFEQESTTSVQDAQKHIALIEIDIPSIEDASSIVQKVVDSFLQEIETFGARQVSWQSYQPICSMDKNDITTDPAQ
ncbi:hypothetical protein K469DRAFT_710674 [Zopfia rhizophila CBS 207.26]|uniref:Uncharacterized protein n=1 Tax=Zopfia rhizophila CBS 207.26 TaxID=1314779 RepID=A0A6A6DXK1_9PEZI|nr:hypothetical protein K469DRAFT_710674 [Zopfia rhizophila CBS 207.26]